MDAGPSTLVDASALDFRALRQADLINIALQRSGVLSDARRPGDLIRGWVEGDMARFEDEVAAKGVIYAQRAFNIIQREFEALQPVLDEMAPRQLADIGCGYGFFGLLAHARYGCDLLLIDIETSDSRHFGFEEDASGYADLEVARRFLLANGVQDRAIATWNPEKEELAAGGRPDLAVSFLACGFHFPVDMYMPFFRYGVAPDGAVILDVRRANYQENRRRLAELGPLRVIEEIGNRRRVLLRKGAS